MAFDLDAPERRALRDTLAELRGRREPAAAGAAGAFSFGIEEEYFLVDAETKAAACRTPDGLFARAGEASGGRVGREFLQAQVEAVTPPHACFARARDELRRMRRTVADAAAAHGLAIMACGTHPTAAWRQVAQSDKPRYDRIMDDLQMVGRRNMLCGMHVHVELPDPARRVDVMCRMIPYVPLFLALSASSPFWQSQDTGLKGYRLAAYDELPRTGLPESFRTAADYDRYVAAMLRAGAMADASHVWWALRPSAAYPTLELRAPDCCTRIDDAIAIAALYRALARHLYHDHGAGRDGDPGAVCRALALENKWRAQRYGVAASFVTEDGAVPLGDVLEQVLALMADDAEALGCADEVAACRAIVARGSSADAQLAVHRAHAQAGAEAALRSVAEWIATATLAD